MSLFTAPQGSLTFPNLDMYHSHCTLSVSFDNVSCLDAYNKMKDTMLLWQPSPVNGDTYSMWSATEIESIWMTRSPKGSKSKDDVQFDYLPVNPNDFRVLGCTVQGKSRSQSLSLYDHHANFCNMWNVLNEVRDA